ncbi:MAG: AbrB/MazE/SpoVT family DNA-binding domain-containing protein [Bacteroidota bacterium]
MQLKIVKIGNSKGIRLPKTVLKEYAIEDSVELVMEPGAILLKPVKPVRKGWQEAFGKMHAAQDDELLIEDLLDEEDWPDED